MPTLASTAEDAIFTDALNHASIIDAIRLSKAQRLIYKHRDLAQLEEMLKTTKARNKLVVTDGVFSMEGDVADLPKLKELANKHDAVLIVDESHATGVLGKTGRGHGRAFRRAGRDRRSRQARWARPWAARSGGYVAAVARRLRLSRAEIPSAALLQRPAARGVLRLDGRDRRAHARSRSGWRSSARTWRTSVRA